MSGTTTTPVTDPTPPLATRISEWGAVVISVIVLLIFGLALWIAYLKGNDTLLINLLSTAAAAFTTAVGFWLGSSYGSSKKTEMLKAAPPAPPASPPPPPKPIAQGTPVTAPLNPTGTPA